jgi:hypothetical protein
LFKLLIIPKEGQPITADRQYKSHQHSTKLETFCKAFTSPICKTLYEIKLKITNYPAFFESSHHKTNIGIIIGVNTSHQLTDTIVVIFNIKSIRNIMQHGLKKK